jgi:hypothetical protein
MVVAGIYCPTKHPLKKLEYLEFLGHLGNRFVVGAILMPRTPTGALGQLQPKVENY